jgi:hypothetical protein
VTKRPTRTARCTEETIAGRLRKAKGFLTEARNIRDLADPDDDIGDAFASLCVLAGIAAADVLCCRAHGYHARSENHQDAIALLADVRPNGSALASGLSRLLSMKTKAAYSAAPVSAEDRRLAERAARQLVAAAGETR